MFLLELILPRSDQPRMRTVTANSRRQKVHLPRIGYVQWKVLFFHSVIAFI